MLGLGIIIGAALMGAIWAASGWPQKPDKHIRYIREWKRSRRAWRCWPKRARHRKTMPLLVKTKTVRQEAPMPLEI